MSSRTEKLVDAAIGMRSPAYVAQAKIVELEAKLEQARQDLSSNVRALSDLTVSLRTEIEARKVAEQRADETERRADALESQLLGERNARALADTNLAAALKELDSIPDAISSSMARKMDDHHAQLLLQLPKTMPIAPQSGAPTQPVEYSIRIIQRDGNGAIQELRAVPV